MTPYPIPVVNCWFRPRWRLRGVAVIRVAGAGSRTPTDWNRACAILVGQAIAALLEEEGRSLGGPLVARIKGSAPHSLMELRPGSTGTTEMRILFTFDADRNAVPFVAGDKAGQWTTWYRQAVPHHPASLYHGPMSTNDVARRAGRSGESCRCCYSAASGGSALTML